MGDMVIVSYAPKAGHAAELERLVRDHVPRLRALGLASDRPNLMMRSRDGSFIEVFEWSAGAVARAHTMREIHAMWAEFGACCDYRHLRDLPEAADMFATFVPFD